jgi:site-specific recombinase XerD
MPQSISRLSRDSVTLSAMLDSWILALQSENKSPYTIRSYADSVRALARHAGPGASTDISTEEIRAFLAAEFDRIAPASVAVHYRNLRVFFGWLAREEPSLMPETPMARIGKPEVPKTRKASLTDAQIKALLAACAGSTLEDRRDTAIIRVLIDTGMRVSGLAGLAYVAGDPEKSDVQLGQRLLTVRLKGGDVIEVPVGRKAVAAIDRYLRGRHRHRHADCGMLWVAPRGAFTSWGIRQMLGRRGRQARPVIDNVGPHRFRRKFAHAWLEGGGTESDLMKITGWKTRDMIEVYAGELATGRAREAHARLSPGDRI